MITDRWLRTKQIFREAVNRPPGERAAYLAEACWGDAALRREIEELLSSHEESTGFMELPAGAGPLDEIPGKDLTATRIGEYYIEEVISSGGMGTVYRAVQERLRRTVAVKVMREGIASRSALRRFEYESQILSRLTHPHIATVYEAGTHREEGGETGGMPYFVMEYIADARPVTEYALGKNLSLTERIRLFLQACEAVHHGHQKGFIHRDLKPSNILVDARGRVKVIDFGIARATDSDLALTTAQTDVGQLLGTVQYMSPEQCKADPNDLDIRSDVYALGVVLYELLCGELPYEVRKSAIFEATRIIREVEPRRPSTILRALRGDMETVLLKALEKERALRYQTVADFGKDLKRVLDGEPILARPAGPVTRALKRVRRNPVVSGAVGVAVLAVLAFIGYLLFVSYPELKRERDLAEAERKKAMEAEQQALLALDEARRQREAALEAQNISREESENTKTMNRFLEEMLSSADPFREGKGIGVTEMLDRAVERIDREFPDRPEIQASLRHTIGLTYFNNGLFDAAEEQLAKALEIRERMLGEDDIKTLFTMVALGSVFRMQGRLPEAESLLRRSLERSLGNLGEEDSTTLQSVNGLALVLQDQGKYDEAEALHRKAMETNTRVRGREHTDTLMAMNNLALVLVAQGDPAEAEDLLREVLKFRSDILANEHPITLSTKNNLAMALKEQGKNDEAEVLYRETLATQSRVLGNEHPNTLDTKHNMANLLADQGKLSEAEDMYREVADIRSRIMGGEHKDTLLTLNNLAIVIKKQGRLEESEVMLRGLLEPHFRALGREHPNTLRLMYNLAIALKVRQKFDEAEDMYREVLKAQSRRLGGGHLDTLMTMNNLGILLRDQGKLDEAAVLLTKGLERSRNTLPRGHQLIAFFLMNSGMCLMKLERYQEAADLLEEGYQEFKRSLGENNPYTRDAIEHIAGLYDSWGKQERAAEWRAKLQ